MRLLILTLMLLTSISTQAQNIIECRVDKRHTTKDSIAMICLEQTKDNPIVKSQMTIPADKWPHGWGSELDGPRPGWREFYHIQVDVNGKESYIRSPLSPCDYESHRGTDVRIPINHCRGMQVFQDEWLRIIAESFK